METITSADLSCRGGGVDIPGDTGDTTVCIDVDNIQNVYAEKEDGTKILQELKKQNALLDQSKIQSVEEYDVTVRVGVVDLGVNLYAKPNLTSIVLAEYTDGVRLVVQGQNKDWALVYNGGTDDVGYMLLEDLEPDIVEDEMLDDIA